MQTIEEPDSEYEEGEQEKAKKEPARSKRKKVTVEETAEFKKFVLSKSVEFAEVDDYEMIVE